MPKRRSTTMIYGTATFHGVEYRVYGKRGGPEDRIIYPTDDPDFMKADFGKAFTVQYRGRGYTAHKTGRVPLGRRKAIPGLGWIL